MGDIQTYFYLALISLIMVSLSLLLVAIVFTSLRRWARQSPAQSPLTFWLIGGAVTVAFLVVAFGTVGVLYGFIRYGAA